MGRALLSLIAGTLVLAGCGDQTQTVAVGQQDTPEATVPVITSDVTPEQQQAAIDALNATPERNNWTTAVVLSEVMTGKPSKLRWKMTFQTKDGIKVGEADINESTNLDTLVDTGDLIQIHHEKEFGVLDPKDVVVLKPGIF